MKNLGKKEMKVSVDEGSTLMTISECKKRRTSIWLASSGFELGYILGLGYGNN